jgi:polyhydroxyalkanoate synthesis repressor PhaR
MTEGTMVRLIKRYGGGSRKLYDTEESRYVSLDEVEAWVQAGQQLRVVDSATAEDVTAQTLAQVIYEAHKAGTATLSVEFLHDAIRKGGRAISEQVDRLQQNVQHLVQGSVAKVPPARLARGEVAALRTSLAALERSVADLESVGGRSRPGNGRRKARRKTKTPRRKDITPPPLSGTHGGDDEEEHEEDRTHEAEGGLSAQQTGSPAGRLRDGGRGGKDLFAQLIWRGADVQKLGKRGWRGREDRRQARGRPAR